MKKIRKFIPLILLILINLFVPLVFNRFVIDGTLLGKDASLVTLLALVCFLLGVGGTWLTTKDSR